MPRTISKPTSNPTPMTGRGIGGNLRVTNVMVKKAAANDRVISGGSK